VHYNTIHHRHILNSQTPPAWRGSHEDEIRLVGRRPGPGERQSNCANSGQLPAAETFIGRFSYAKPSPHNLDLEHACRMFREYYFNGFLRVARRSVNSAKRTLQRSDYSSHALHYDVLHSFPRLRNDTVRRWLSFLFPGANPPIDKSLDHAGWQY
jgi:hypothetical protein